MTNRHARPRTVRDLVKSLSRTYRNACPGLTVITVRDFAKPALVAFFVNVAAALVLIPHRKGDANMRAVWLFSRNDAIGNLAVVVAAVLVWWFSSPWPDLVVAFAVAGLFLQSAWSIIRDARSDLAQAPQA